MTDEQIQERVLGRTEAAALFSLADVGNDMPLDYRKSFWRFVYEQAYAHLDALGEAPQVVRPKLVPMNDAEAKWFEREPMPFGKHIGSVVGVVLRDDPAYLDWLVRATEEDTFKDNLRRFLARPDVQEVLPE